jgi:cyclopropane fatty-acyl-phospholipid synthase-like methyltransferase
MLKPVSQPCLRNQDPIYQTLKKYTIEPGNLLEVGCGTGQHAVYMSERLPHIHWQATDRQDALVGANLWISESQFLPTAIELDISMTDWQDTIKQSISGNEFLYAYSANVVHFVSNELVDNLFKGLSNLLNKDAYLFLYGPFNIDGFTSKGNEILDEWLKSDIDPLAGIKELSNITKLANNNGFDLTDNKILPANNHLLVFKKES